MNPCNHDWKCIAGFDTRRNGDAYFGNQRIGTIKVLLLTFVAFHYSSVVAVVYISTDAESRV